MTPGSDAAAWLRSAVAYEIVKGGSTVTEQPRFHIPVFSRPVKYVGNARCVRCDGEITLRDWMTDQPCPRAKDDE